MAETKRLDGKWAVVTGACSGIGLQFARRLAELGCNLVMVSNRDRELCEAASDIATTHGVETVPMTLDLTAADCADGLLEFTDARGLEIDILINNAGIFSFNPITDTPEGKINCFIDLHMRAVTLLSRAFAARMQKRGSGYMLNMSSMSCWMPMPGLAMYAATKAYIRVFTRSLHYELKDSGVKVTVACPGGIATSLFGLPDNLMRLALRLKAVDTPEAFTRKAVKKMLKGKKQYINGGINRMAIVFIGILPTRVRMLVKHLMLDKNIRRP